jgi:hypothetical protein
MRKQVVIVVASVLGALAVCGSGVALFVNLFSGMTDAADQFFVALKAHDYPAARALMAEEFRAGTTDEQLAALVERSALSSYKTAHWSSRSIQNGRGRLAGSLETEGGGSIPMELSLVKERGGWRIYALRKPAAGIDGDTSPKAADAPEGKEI